MLNAAQREARERLVLDHFHDEVVQEWDHVLSTFPHPHYEIIPILTVYDGQDEVRQYYRDSRVAFPDQDHEIISFRHAEDAVVTEFWLMGTHLGPLGAIPATGSRFRVRMTAFFIFDENENLICERIYFDSLSMFRQLIAGLNLRHPKNWWLLVKAIRGLSSMSRDPAPSLLQTTPPDFPHYHYVSGSERR